MWGAFSNSRRLVLTLENQMYGLSRSDRKHFSYFLTILLEKLFVNFHLFCWNVYCATAKQIALASSAKPDELKTNSEIANVDDLIQGETSSGNVKKSKLVRIFSRQHWNNWATLPPIELLL